MQDLERQDRNLKSATVKLKFEKLGFFYVSLGTVAPFYFNGVLSYKPDRLKLSVDLFLGQTKKEKYLELPTLPFRNVERYTGFDGKIYCQRLAHTRMGAW